MKKMAIGLMSGTSMDGLDVFIGEICRVGRNIKVKQIFFKTYPYDLPFKEKLFQAIDLKKSTPKLLASLNYEIAEVASKCVFLALDEAKLSSNNIEFIASHGQTIYHIPRREKEDYPSSLQLGDGSVLANLTNIPVVSNFRMADIAVGGEGAPLVPFAHYRLFSNKKKSRIIQNIGGISNLSFLPKHASTDDVIAFDNGPGNMMIDAAMEYFYHESYDKDGEIASEGNIINPLLNEVLSHPYFQELPPKSTGRELFGRQYTLQLIKKYNQSKKEDIVHTFTRITAKSIALSIQKFLPYSSIDEMILVGGGAKNPVLVSMIQEELPSFDVTVSSNSTFGDSLEALSFMILGYETMHHRPSNIPHATGASKKTILGQVSPVIRK